MELNIMLTASVHLAHLHKLSFLVCPYHPIPYTGPMQDSTIAVKIWSLPSAVVYFETGYSTCSTATNLFLCRWR